VHNALWVLYSLLPVQFEAQLLIIKDHSKVKQTQDYKPESSSSTILGFILLSYRYRHGAVSQFSATHHTLLHCH